MRFVSKHANYMFVARPDKVQMVLGSGGMMQPMTVQNAIICEFRHGLVRPEEAELAKQHWLGFGRREDGSLIAYGATPMTVVGVVNGQAHGDWNPDLMFSVYDTEEIFDLEDRAYAERRLMEDAGFGQDHILVSGKALEAPWPTYEDMRGVKGNPASKQIVDMVRAGGYDIEYVITYEQREKPRDEVVEALDALRAELAAEAEESAALSREIPA